MVVAQKRIVMSFHQNCFFVDYFFDDEKKLFIFNITVDIE